MKYLKLTTLLLLTAITFISCGESVISYNDTIITPMISIGESIDKFETAKTKEDFEEIATEIVGYAKTGIKSTEVLEGFNGNTSFRDSAIEYYKNYISFFDGKDVVHNLMIGFAEGYASDEDYNTKGYLTFSDELEKLIELEDRLVTEQEQFADANNMLLEEVEY